MEENKEIKYPKFNDSQTQEFSTTFAVLLCLFFIYLFRISIGAFGQLSFSLIPDVSGGVWRLVKAIYYALFYLWLVFGFWAIVLSLKKAPSAIPSLRLCLICHLLAFLLSMYAKRLTPLRYWSLFLFVGIAFFVLFLLYLTKSKRLTILFPKKNRRRGLLFWLEIVDLLIFMCLLFIIWAQLQRKESVVTGYLPNEYRLLSNELSDGRAIFTPSDSWNSSLQPIHERGNTLYCFKDTVSYAVIEVTISGEAIPESRSEYVYTVYENQPLATNSFRAQLSHSSFFTKEQFFYFDQYQYQDDTSSFFWTYSTLGSMLRPISIRLSYTEKDSLTMTVAETKRFFDKVMLDIKPRLLKKDD